MCVCVCTCKYVHLCMWRSKNTVKGQFSPTLCRLKSDRLNHQGFRLPPNQQYCSGSWRHSWEDPSVILCCHSPVLRAVSHCLDQIPSALPIPLHGSRGYRMNPSPVAQCVTH